MKKTKILRNSHVQSVTLLSDVDVGYKAKLQGKIHKI